MTTGKTIALTRWTFDDKVMSLLFNMLSRLVITFLPRSKVKVKSLSRVLLFEIPWTVVYQASLSMGFSRQEYWSGLPLPSPGDLPDPGIKPKSPALQADTLPSEPPGKPPRILECVAIPFSRGSSQPRNQTWVSCIASGFLTIYTTREAQGVSVF